MEAETVRLDLSTALLERGVRKAVAQVNTPGPGQGELRPSGVTLDVTTGELHAPTKTEPEPTEPEQPADEPRGPDISAAQAIIRRFSRELRQALTP